MGVVWIPVLAVLFAIFLFIFISVVFSVVASVLERYSDRARAIRELSMLSDLELKDLGITRGDIERVVDEKSKS